MYWYLFRFGDCHKDPVRFHEDRKITADCWSDAFDEAEAYFLENFSEENDDWFVLLDLNDPRDLDDC